MNCEYKTITNNSTCIYYLTGNFCKLNRYFLCEDNDMRTYISHSQIQLWDTCRFKYWLRYGEGIRVKPHKLSSALKMGVLWDKVKDNNWIHYEPVIEEYQIGDYDVAKVRALERASEDLIRFDRSSGLYQIEETVEFQGVPIKGVYDVLYDTHFDEYKLTRNPSFYTEAFEIQSQIGTYFFLKPELEYCTMKIVVTPQLKYSGKAKGNEWKNSPQEYEDRIYSDILSRPSKYFIGFNRSKKDFGIKFYRTDFNIERLTWKYKTVFEEIQAICEKDPRKYFYQQPKGCRMFGFECEYMDICKTSCINEDKYIIEKEETNANKMSNVNE